MVIYNPSESEEKILGVGELCTQDFIVYDQAGNPVSGGWVVHADGKTCTVGFDGRCSLTLVEGAHIIAYAEKAGESSTKLGFDACIDLVELWQKVECDTPTPNHASGCELLLHWDKDNDGILNRDETVNALMALMNCIKGDPCPDPISINEGELIIQCFEIFAGVIVNMCPSCEYPAHDTALTIDVVDVNGNPITTAFVGDTIYLSGQLSDVVTGELLTGAMIKLFRNAVDTGLTNTTNESGVYSIPYTVVSGDMPTVRFKTKFESA